MNLPENVWRSGVKKCSGPSELFQTFFSHTVNVICAQKALAKLHLNQKFMLRKLRYA